MSVLVVGASHRSAPVAVLERLALDAEGAAKVLDAVVEGEHVREAAVISTCNRLEVYADVDRFHGSVEEVTRLLLDRAGHGGGELLQHLYVHYDDGAVSHLFQVAAGLDSMAVGEGQILGQVRSALGAAQDAGTAGPALNALFQQALRVGKRARAETGIDRAAPSLVSAALDRAVAAVGDLSGGTAVVVGAGSMAGLAAATLSRQGVARLTVVNRSADRAERLATAYDARTAVLADLPDVVGDADVVLSCTGATGVLVTRAMMEQARAGATGPVAVVDLALPHDVEPEVADLPGVTHIGLARLAEELRDGDAAAEVAGVRAIVAEEVTAFLTARHQASVAPTVVALRSMATTVVEAEVERLDQRLPDLDEGVRAEVLHAVRRVADKLLHRPTVRVKELAGEDGAVSYAAALAELFSLDPEAVDAVTRPAVSEGPSGTTGQAQPGAPLPTDDPGATSDAGGGHP